VRRPHPASVDRFPVELDTDLGPTLRTRQRGHKSGRFISPAGMRVAVETDGSIASVVSKMIEASVPQAADVHDRPTPSVPLPVFVNVPEAAESETLIVAEPDLSPSESPAEMVGRVAVMFATAAVAGATTVYYFLRG
jgi:hypothetical protein